MWIMMKTVSEQWTVIENTDDATNMNLTQLKTVLCVSFPSFWWSILWILKWVGVAQPEHGRIHI